MKKFQTKEQFEDFILQNLTNEPTLTAAFILNLGLSQDERKEAASLYHLKSFSAEKIFKEIASRNSNVCFHDKEGNKYGNKVIYLKQSSDSNINRTSSISQLEKYIKKPNISNTPEEKLKTDDIILLNKLEQYKKNHCPYEKNQGIVFGQFVNSVIIENDQQNCFENNESLLDSVCVDGSYDLGIDGLCIIVNGKLVESDNYINLITEREHIKNVEIFFIQSKFKSKIVYNDIAPFVNGIRQFFEKQPTRPTNQKIDYWLKIKNQILENPEAFSDEFKNIKIHIFYVMPSSWNRNKDIEGEFQKLESDLNSSGLFHAENTIFVDREMLLQLSNKKIEAEKIQINGELPLSSSSRFGGIATKMKASELLKILTDPKTSMLRPGLFEKNVRDYQGKNSVNEDIEKTIREDPESFIIRNNGITILVSEYTKDANGLISLKNPQIVNGCQTCYSIFLTAKNKVSDISSVEVFVKIIKTDDSKTINDVVTGNNNQTPVDVITNEITKEYHQKLEKFFNAKADSEVILKHGVRYERRSNSLRMEYGNTIYPYQKCKFKDLLYSALAVWFDAPYKYGAPEALILKDKNFENRIFLPADKEIIYYAAASLFSNYERLCFENKIDSEHKRCKPQVACIFRYLIDNRPYNIERPDFAISTSNKILEIINNEEQFEKQIAECLSIFDKAKEKYIEEYGNNAQYEIYNKNFNAYLLEILSGENSTQKTIYGGTVSVKGVSFHGDKYLIILDSDRNEIFAHQANSTEDNFNIIKEGDYVIFEPYYNSKNNKLYANNVRIPPTIHAENIS